MSTSGFDWRCPLRVQHRLPAWLRLAPLRARGPAPLPLRWPFAAAEATEAVRHG